MSLDLDAIKARIDAAAPGPWYTDGYDNVVTEQGDLLSDTPDAELTAQFIAHSREDVPALVAEVERRRWQARMVRQLHQQSALVTRPYCAGCGDAWPCMTIRLLDGEP